MTLADVDKRRCLSANVCQFCSVSVYENVSSYHTLGAGIAQLVVLGLAATVSRVRYSSGDIFQ